MQLWLDAQISPVIATWITAEFSISCFALRELGLRDASDQEILAKAKANGDVIIITKDEDFCELLSRLHAPPRIIWLSFGNCSNNEMRSILRRDLLSSLSMLKENDLVEVSA